MVLEARARGTFLISAKGRAPIAVHLIVGTPGTVVTSARHPGTMKAALVDKACSVGVHGRGGGFGTGYRRVR